MKKKRKKEKKIVWGVLKIWTYQLNRKYVFYVLLFSKYFILMFLVGPTIICLFKNVFF